MPARPLLAASIGEKAGRAVVALGILLRLGQLLNGRPLWLDEASLTLNILTRPLDGFLRPLDYQQLSPLGFLWAERLVTRLAGPGEVALRLIPFAAGALALVGFARLARRLLDPPAAIVATALAALSPLLLRYSAEVKSYELDALTAILLILATLDLAESGSAQNLRRWALAAALAALVSVPAPFTVGGSALALLIVPRIRRDPGALLRLAGAAAPAALLFGLQMRTVYHAPETMSFMRDYWAGSFLERSFAGGMAGLAKACQSLWLRMLFGDDPYRYPHGTILVLVLVLSAAGAVSLARRNRLGIALLLVPLLLAAFAGLAERWPLVPRLLLFGAPAVFLTVAAGLSAVARMAPARVRAAALAAGAIAVIAATGMAGFSELRNPSAFEPLPQAMAEVATRHGPDATVYVGSYFTPACAYYSQRQSGGAGSVADSTKRACAIPGARTVPGRGVPVNADGKLSISAAWTADERARILEAGGDEVWFIVLKRSLVVEALRPAIEEAGAVPVFQRELAGIGIYQYRLPPRH